ncbi:permease [Paenibacillus dendritiformis]|uniref:permease n=1 Tax=Paenibacillus dendritiformis TaxID=130049 RepID=UPI00143CD5D4|nr:permease [Paenibacillus dendritiformis]NKI21683.1 permease [Paenibacillus dendritiformis]NRF97933.1 permease [Paenibacillus dendritiformis]
MRLRLTMSAVKRLSIWVLGALIIGCSVFWYIYETSGRSWSTLANLASPGPEEVEIYNVQSMPLKAGEEDGLLVVLTEPSHLRTIDEAISSARPIEGVAKVAQPHFRIHYNNTNYYVWLSKDEQYGAFMNADQSHTLYSLSDRSINELQELFNDLQLWNEPKGSKTGGGS